MSLTILLLDNYDSFTFMLKDYIEQHGAECLVKRNDDENLLQEVAKCDALVISPGPKSPDKAGKLMQVIERYHQHKPILGVCLGHQAIGQFFGFELVKATKPMHGKIDSITHKENRLFSGVPNSFKATRYHSLLLTQEAANMDVIALSSQNEIMAIAHKQLPIWGIQFHPESCSTEAGLTLIGNFLLLANQKQ